MSEQKTAAEMAAEIKADHAKAFDSVKEIAERALAEAQSGNQLAANVKEKADEALIKLNTLGEQLAELEQKAARGGEGGGDKEKSIGEQFVESDAYKAFAAEGFARSGKASLSLKTTLTSATTDSAGSVGDAINQTRLPGIMPLPERRMTVRDLLSQGRMDGNTIEYVKETGFTNSAAATAEAASKPESDLKFDLVSTSAKVIAHWTKASRQVLSDISQLQSYIDNRLRYGLAYVEENELLNGDNTGQHLNGIVTQATAYSAPFTPEDDNGEIDQIRLMMLQAALAEYPATGIVMHPTDWARIELTKDANGQYIIGVPQGMAPPRLWSLPVVATQAMTVDKVLVGAFKLGAQVFDRWDARVETGYVNDDFIKNLVTILAEERLALAVYRPEAFIYGDLGNV